MPSCVCSLPWTVESSWPTARTCFFSLAHQCRPHRPCCSEVRPSRWPARGWRGLRILPPSRRAWIAGTTGIGVVPATLLSVIDQSSEVSLAGVAHYDYAHCYTSVGEMPPGLRRQRPNTHQEGRFVVAPGVAVHPEHSGRLAQSGSELRSCPPQRAVGRPRHHTRSAASGARIRCPFFVSSVWIVFIEGPG